MFGFQSGMRWWLQSLFIVALVSSLTACQLFGSSFSDKTQQLEVDYFKAQCASDSTDLCFRIRSDENDSWAVSKKLQGFSGFEWGQRYQLKVRTSFDSDGKPKSYRFLSIQEESSITNAFTMTLYTATGILSKGSGDAWLLPEGRTFDCSGDACSAIQRAVDDRAVIQLELTASRNALTLSKVKCQSSSNNFSAECEGVSNNRWFISHFQSDCNRTEAQLCLVYRVSASDDWELLTTDSSDISSFTPAWGMEYRIDVSQTLSSGGQLTQASLRKKDDNPVDRKGNTHGFKWVVQAESLAASNSDNRITLYDGNQIMNCDTLCPTINQAITDRHLLLLGAYVDDAGETVITAVHCNEDAGSDFDKCVKDSHSGVTWWP